jgi:hypothetical protein
VVSPNQFAEDPEAESVAVASSEDRLYGFWLGALTVLVMFCALAIAAVAFNHGFHHGVMATIFLLMVLGLVGSASLK